MKDSRQEAAIGGKMHNLTGYATVASEPVARNEMESGYEKRT